MSSSSIATLHTLAPNATIPIGYFDEDNIRFIQNRIIEVLGREFRQNIRIDRGSIIRIMERVAVQRLESVPKMNQRVVMYLTNDFRTHQLQSEKHMKLEAHYVLSQRLYDPSTEISKYDPQNIKTAGSFRGPMVGSTTRFYFT